MATLLASSNVEIAGLYRYPVKGLSGDTVEHVLLQNAAETFPDDRRYALLWKKNEEKWNDSDPEWIHKENFLCAFTAPKLFAQFVTSYQIVSNKDSSSCFPCDKVNKGEDEDQPQRLLTVKERSTKEVVLGPVDLQTAEGREQLAKFFGEKSGKDVICVTATGADHKHQFGNTSSGVKARRDTRTLHIVNAATVRELSSTLQVPIYPTRFRPNIVLEGLEPWEEFKWVGQRITCGDMKLSVIQRTVRCDGVSIDPLDPTTELDIPKLLAQNYPEHGPFLGVYAMVDKGGTMSIGDSVNTI